MGDSLIDISARDIADAERVLREVNQGRPPFYSHIPMAARVLATVRSETEDRLLRAFGELAERWRTREEALPCSEAAEELERLVMRLRGGV
jgi:sugar-specific transcriptional regulator TrmB